ncbi:MAG TPA: VOC family protein, partial [Acidimicrobiales bacterium]|nr:VOC family protein [Acidimicrobiales bacterium]
MPTTDSHSPGRPCWVDQSTETTEQRHGLMHFYSAIFGWTYDEGPEETGHYTIASNGSHAVLGLGQQEGGDGEALTYFATDDIDASAKRAAELGGTVVFGPMDVMDVGKMAIVIDPTGARHGLWQPGTFAGFGQIYEVGSPGWFNHDSADPAAAAAYYSGLTGFPATEPEPGMRVLSDGDQWFASISAAMSPTRPARWNPIYITDSLE